MNTYNVIQLGNPKLRLISEPFTHDEFGTENLKTLADNLIKIMMAEKGIGLAAPQIGLNKRALAFGMNQHPIRTDLPSIPFTVLFNPSYEPTTDVLVEEYEGCLSVGKLRAKVPRYKSIYYKGYDAEGRLIEQEVSDVYARVIQHELDHLNGVMFLDKVTDYGSLGFHEELIASGALTSGKTG